MLTNWIQDMFIVELKDRAYVVINWYNEILRKINIWGSLKKNIILALLTLTQYDFFKDPIYFRNTQSLLVSTLLVFFWSSRRTKLKDPCG